MTAGVLFSQMEPPAGTEEEFHHWYDTDHIPVRMAVPGFAAASRYEAVEGSPRYLAIYELSDLAALQSPAYAKVKAEPSAATTKMLGAVSGFTRYIGEEIADSGPAGTTGPFIAVVAFAVPPSGEAEFDDWYDSEHSPLLLAAPDWLRVRRYRVIDGEGGPWTRLAVHELANLEVMDSPERARARQGPKRDALAERPWFANSGRWLYRRLNRVEAGS